MAEHSVIEAFLNEIRPRVYKFTLSPEEASRLLEITTTHCVLDAEILLLWAAWSDDHHKYFEEWTTYFEQALQNERNCWSNDDIIRLYQLGVSLYGFDEKDDLAFAAASELYRRAPNKWEAVHTYLGEGQRIFEEDQYVTVLNHLVELKPPTALASYTVAYYFELLWRRYAKGKYKQESIRYFQEALDLNLHEEEPQAAEVAKRALDRLRNPDTQDH